MPKIYFVMDADDANENGVIDVRDVEFREYELYTAKGDAEVFASADDMIVELEVTKTFLVSEVKKLRILDDFTKTTKKSTNKKKGAK